MTSEKVYKILISMILKMTGRFMDINFEDDDDEEDSDFEEDEEEKEIEEKPTPKPKMSRRTSSPKSTSSKKTFKKFKPKSTPCEAGKLFNPATGNCIADTAPNRKRLGLEPKMTEKKETKKKIAKSPKKKNSQSSCKSIGKLYNPVTGNCIADTASNRRKVLGKSPTKNPAEITKNSPRSCKKMGKLYNPGTGNCIADTLPNRRKITSGK